MVTHPSSNRAQRRVTSFMRRTTLPLRQTPAGRPVVSVTVRVCPCVRALKGKRLELSTVDIARPRDALTLRSKGQRSRSSVGLQVVMTVQVLPRDAVLNDRQPASSTH